MLRYLRAVQMMKKIIEENNLTVMATVARYAAAYEAIAKLDWWDKSKRYNQIYHIYSDFNSHTARPAAAQSLNRERISATCRAILAGMSTSTPSRLTLSSGTKLREGSRRCQLMSR